MADEQKVKPSIREEASADEVRLVVGPFHRWDRRVLWCVAGSVLAMALGNLWLLWLIAERLRALRIAVEGISR